MSDRELLDKAESPFRDYAGQIIYEGDEIIHPSGECGIVVFIPALDDPNDAWKVSYSDSYIESRLCLQVGDKGCAVVNDASTIPRESDMAQVSLMPRRCGKSVVAKQAIEQAKAAEIASHVASAKRAIACLDLPPPSYAHLRDHLRIKTPMERNLEKMVKERGIKEGDLALRLARQIDKSVVHDQVLRIAGARFTVKDPAQA
jgi:hypothetical protein